MDVWTMRRMGAVRIGFCAVLAVGGWTPSRAADREMIAVDPQSMKFAAVPGMPGCATVAILRGDPRKGPSVVLLKLAGGCRVPWHWHTANEELLVVSGVGVLDMPEDKPLLFRPGAYASLPSHHAHQ